MIITIVILKRKKKVCKLFVSKVNLATVVEGDPKLLHRDVVEGATHFQVLLHFTLDTYLILLSVKQGTIK